MDPPPERALADPFSRFSQATLSASTEEARKWEARTLILSNAWMAQTQNLGNCNTQIQGLEVWNTRQQEVGNERQ